MRTIEMACIASSWSFISTTSARIKCTITVEKGLSLEVSGDYIYYYLTRFRETLCNTIVTMGVLDIV